MMSGWANHIELTSSTRHSYNARLSEKGKSCFWKAEIKKLNGRTQECPGRVRRPRLLSPAEN